MNAMPLISVILPAYNAAHHVDEALKSMLRQSFTDQEVIVIDDGSTDGTAAAIEKFNDPRIRLLRNEANRGIVFSLNRGLAEARGRYIVRMDADDIALPRRLERQVAFMESHAEVGLCGTWARKFISYGPRWIQRAPVSSSALKTELLFATPFVHPSVMIRRSVIEEHALQYREEYETAEDYQLWCEMATIGELAVIPEVLLAYRVSFSSVTGSMIADEKRWSRRMISLQKIWSGYLQATLGLIASEINIPAHALFYEKRFAGRKMNADEKAAAREWISLLQKKNAVCRAFDAEALAKVCAVQLDIIDRDTMGDLLRRTLRRLAGTT